MYEGSKEFNVLAKFNFTNPDEVSLALFLVLKLEALIRDFCVTAGCAWNRKRDSQRLLAWSKAYKVASSAIDIGDDVRLVIR